MTPNQCKFVLKLSVAEQTISRVGVDLSTLTRVRGWEKGSLATNGRIYFSPSRAKQVLMLDIATQSVRLVGPKLTDGNHGAGFYGGVVLNPSDGIMYGLCKGDQILRIMPPALRLAEPVSTIDNMTAEGGFDGWWYGGARDPETGRIFLMPGMLFPRLDSKFARCLETALTGSFFLRLGGAKQVLVFDPRTETRRLIGPDLFADRFDLSHMYMACCVAPGVGDGNSIYGVPCVANRMLKINPRTDVVSEIGPDLSDKLAPRKWRTAVMANNGYMYALPADSTKVLKFDIKRESATFLETGLQGKGQKYAGCVHFDRFGRRGLSWPASGHYLTDLTPSAPRPHPTTHRHPLFVYLFAFRAALGSDGNIYGIPATANCLMRVDTQSDEVSTICHCKDFEGEEFKYGGAVAGPGGHFIFGLPAKAGRVLKFDVKRQSISFIGPELVRTHGHKYESGCLAEDGRIYAGAYFLKRPTNNL